MVTGGVREGYGRGYGRGTGGKEGYRGLREMLVK